MNSILSTKSNPIQCTDRPNSQPTVLFTSRVSQNVQNENIWEVVLKTHQYRYSSAIIKISKMEQSLFYLLFSGVEHLLLQHVNNCLRRSIKLRSTQTAQTSAKAKISRGSFSRWGNTSSPGLILKCAPRSSMTAPLDRTYTTSY